MMPNAGLPSISDDPKIGNDDGDMQMIVDAISKSDLNNLDTILKLLDKRFAEIKAGKSDVAEDDEETGDNPNASKKERDALGVDAKRRAFDAKDVARGKTVANFEERFPDAAKINTNYSTSWVR